MFRLEQTSRLSILQVATVNKPITSAIGYGPIETVIYNIDKGLHALGHRSIVACSSDSAVTGERFATVPQSHGDYWCGHNPAGAALVDTHLAQALARVKMGDIDIVHMHDWLERTYTGSFHPPVPTVMTLHVPAEHSGIAEFRERHPDVFFPLSLTFVAISEYQRQQYAKLIPEIKTVMHGIDVQDHLISHGYNPGGYLFNIGRITEVKGQDIAISVARKSGAKLILAGCVQNKSTDQAYYQRLIPSIDLVLDIGSCQVGEDYYEKIMKPILTSDKQVIYVGELGAAAKNLWYRHAQATLFPVRWGEPFGMVMIESMAAGTPVLAFREGAVPEIVKDGETGFILDSVESMVEAVGRLDHIDRRKCWKHVKSNFSIQRMAQGYAALYEQLVRAPASRQPSVLHSLAPQGPLAPQGHEYLRPILTSKGIHA